ncbi:MAG TPA: ester cyclase [Candidatus Polarisedimenticolia bacterium]|nr:ester cyclase [Candidatus Polarisedimenticolia bacterium]
MSELENLTVLKRSLERFNAKDLEGYLEMFDRSVVFHGLSRKLKPGVAGLREYYTQLRQGFPDMRLASEDVIAEGEKTANRYTFYGTHKGDYLGIAPTMKLVISPGIVMHLFRNGKCVETWFAGDSLGFLTQIGAAPQIALKR